MVRFSNEVVDAFKKDFISSDNLGTAFLVLLALQSEDYDFLDRLDDSNKDRKMILLYRDLVYKGYLLENEDAQYSDNVLFSLTKKSKDLLSSYLNKAEEMRRPIVEEPREELLAKPLTIKESFDPKDARTWIKDWLNLWPTKRKDGYLIKSASGNCGNKMDAFLRLHPEFDKDLIYEATKLYLEQQSKKEYEYTMTSSNFISKQDAPRSALKNSVLEAYCELIMNGDVDKVVRFTELEDNSPF